MSQRKLPRLHQTPELPEETEYEPEDEIVIAVRSALQRMQHNAPEQMYDDYVPQKVVKVQKAKPMPIPVKKNKVANEQPYYQLPPQQHRQPVQMQQQVGMKATGTKEDVWANVALRTGGGLTKADLTLNAKGKVVSLKKSLLAKRTFAGGKK